MKFQQPAPPSVQEAEAALEAAKKAEETRKELAARQREEERRQRAELVKQAEGVAADVRRQVDDALDLATQNPPRPTHFSRTVARGYLRGVLAAPDSMSPAEGRVAQEDAVLATLLAAAQQAANRLNYFCSPLNDDLPVWLGADDEPIREMDRAEADAWRAFTRRIREIASEN
jgi:hypothetical protein